MKKFKLNRFNVIVICVSFVLLLFLVSTFFHTYSDYVTRDASKIEGDTVYINDLASDYYYYLGMNYVGDVDNSTTNYTESDLKMVTINYYGYPSGNTSQSGYVSLTERQNKFVYYKYFPVKNGNITFQLIDNPFTDRPNNKGFGGWTSSNGTISTDANTKVQSITISSSTSTVNIYATWSNANVIYLGGLQGDDSLSGLSPDKPVATWSKAFQLLRSNATDRNNREINVIVLTGNINYAINKSQAVTQTYSRFEYVYDETNSSQNVLLVYQSGNTKYALNDNYTNVQALTLSSSSEPPATAYWTVSQVSGGYTIRNTSTNRYLAAVQYYNDQIALIIQDGQYIWSHDGDINGFYHDFTVTVNKYQYVANTTFNNGSTYLITKGTNPMNALTGAGNNTELDEYNYSNTMEWRIQNNGGNNYTIYNTGSNQYLNYTSANSDATLALGNSHNWTYDSANRTFSSVVTYNVETRTFNQSNIANQTGVMVGYVSNGNARLLGLNGNSVVQQDFTVNDTVGNEFKWNISNSYRLRNAGNNRYVVRSGTGFNTQTGTNGATWSYSTSTHLLYVRSGNTYYYFHDNNGSWNLVTSTNQATPVYIISLRTTSVQHQELRYLAYNNGWKLETSNTNATVDFTTYTTDSETSDQSYYVRYNSGTSNFSIGINKTGAALDYMTSHLERDIRSTSTGTTSDNSNYTTGNTNVAATITSVYNGVDYRSSATWIMTTASNAYSQVTAQNDLQLENLRVQATGYNQLSDANESNNYTNTHATLLGNYYNVRIGRGMTPTSWTNNSASIFCFAMGGSATRSLGDSSNDNNKYRFAIESGRYSSLFAFNTVNATVNTRRDFYGQMEWVLGNDYDRATNDNTKMDLYYRFATSTRAGVFGKNNHNTPAYLIYIKSGNYAKKWFDNNHNDSTISYTGLYVGGLLATEATTTRDISPRVLIMEGGELSNINGGLRIYTNDASTVKTRIYIKNGVVGNIIGGAGVATTHGDRYISVTGGEVEYSVTGGSNGYLATSATGKLNGDTYVHIGGEAQIGTIGSGDLFLVNYGSVLGAGNGNSSSAAANAGQVNNTHISVSDDAIIYGDVFGGGNYGTPLQTVNVQIDGGTIYGNVFGASNYRGAGTVTVNGSSATSKSGGNINITMNGGEIKKTLYGGSYSDGNVAGVVTININGGKIGYDSEHEGSVFGGGYGSNTNVTSGVNINIRDDYTTLIEGTVYGGSALGKVIGNIVVSAVDDNDPGTITIKKDVYCGAMGDSSINNSGAVYGNCTLSLDGGKYEGSVFGENNASGSPNGTVTVTIGGHYTTEVNNVYGGGNEANSGATSVTLNIEDYSDINNAFGGGNKATVPNTLVNLNGGEVGNLYGGSNEQGNITSTHINVTGGAATNIYGGNNLGGSVTTSNITIEDGDIGSVYGGGYQATTGTSIIDLKGGEIDNTYGGGHKAGITTSATITLEGADCGNIYGGSNESGNLPVSYITATSGSADNIYGGNNVGGVTTTTHVTISNITAGNVYGGGCSADTGTNYVTINSGTIGSVYGGGESASVTNSTHVSVLGGKITNNLFGGSNTSGTVPVSHVEITNGEIGTIYGGNNAGGTTTTTNITVTTGKITNIYGGGKSANSTTTNIEVNGSTNEISYIFGGCEQANATTTNVILNDGSAANVFGGSNTSGTITTSNVEINDGTYGNVFGGNNAGGKTVNANLDILGGTTTNVYGGGNNAETDYAIVLVDDAEVTTALYGGGKSAAVNYNTSVTVQNSSEIGGNIYGGGDNGQVLGNTSVTIKTSSEVDGSVFGGGNNAAVVGNTTVLIDNATIDTNLYGGGNNGQVQGNTGVTIKSSSEVSGNVYGGGNNAAVVGNTNLLIDGATVESDLYGGGKNGQVQGSTNVNIKNATISASAYAGGEGGTAIVGHNTSILVQGTTHITQHVFGGGNAAETGNSASDNSLGVVNITGGIIGGNVYGGANTSVLYGETVVNIGFDAVTTYMNSNDFTKGDIRITGTVFGGGEANASGSEVYDFDFISVTRGIIINIDGNGHSQFDILGSIFGSGNASRTTGYSRIYINNYGTNANVKNNVSLQRADLAVINNSHIALSGATDRTNEYSQVVFSISRITELDLKNNSEIFFDNGANLLNRYRSLNSDGTIATVTINPNTHSVSKSTNNRLYMHEDKVLNIALNQNVTAYGEVDGMTFFGMFKRDRYGNVVRAMYNTDYETGDVPADGELYYFNSGSYVLGLHEVNHNITVDGFYTNYDDPDNPGHILVDYITPTPENAEHYMWTIGVSVQSYDIELIASKYSTLGTYEFPFINNATGNTTFSIVGFNYDTLDTDVSLINPDNIPRIASSGSVADNTMGLAIKPGIGWVSVGRTYFLTDSANLYEGTINYKSENSTITPSFVFYLYHSKNLQTEGLVGNVIVSVLVVTPIDDLTNSVERINFNITITRAIFDSNDYEGAMTPGRQYEMFTSSSMDITPKSSLSAYYSLYMESNQNIYRTGYHRVLTSNVILPVNTKITMIDFASATKPEYYYYIVNSTDNAILQPYYNLHGEVEYDLSKFIRMGSLDSTNTYSDAVANGIYYDNDNDRAIEEFIFIVDFKDANITTNMYDCSLLLDLVDADDNVIRSVLGIQRSNLVYNIHANQLSVIEVDADVSKSILYAGDIEDLHVTITFNQNDNQSLNRIVDTTYYEKKLGLKISFFNERNEQVNGVDLMGTSLTLDGVTYYARSDGTIRFKVADKVANSYSNIRINTENSSLAAGNYTIKVEAFYSTDGIYFGRVPSDTDTTSFRMMNKSYGLKVTIPENELIIETATGNNINNNKNLHATIEYSGLLIHPKLRVALYRRSYSDVYELDYNLVDLSDYVINELSQYGTNTKIYNIINALESTNTYTFNFGTSLVTGTYKLEFRLYDDDAYVGNVIKYVIIK